MSRKENYGRIKMAVIEAHAAGMTYAEVSDKYSIKRASIYAAAAALKISLKPSKHKK